MSQGATKILYIEDDAANRSLVRKLLSAAGYKVIEALDGISGIDIAKAEHPDIILTDMNMPGLDGYETSTRIKAMDGFKDVPIIAVTANALAGDKERSLIAGCDGYIAKPIDPDTFADEVKSYLAGKKEHVAETERDNYLQEYSDKLVERLEQKVRELSDANAELEQRVDEKITELQTANEQLLQSEKLASIGQLAAGVAHEINNPVGFITSNIGTLGNYINDLLDLLNEYEQAEAALDGNVLLERIREVKQRIDIDFLKQDIGDLIKESSGGVKRVKQIVQDLKDFSRVDTAEWQWADLQRGIDSTLNIVANELKYKADVVKEFGTIPEIECVPAQLNQVFVNLLVNAAQAMEERGTITIRTGMDGEDKVWVSISDTGSGIPAEVVKRIFDPFFTTKPVGTGTGLGLSISYGIINKHGGNFEVKSQEGKGTEFVIHLPIRQAESKADADVND